MWLKQITCNGIGQALNILPFQILPVIPKEVFLANGKAAVSSSSGLGEGLAAGCCNAQSCAAAKLSWLV